jgi:hypothetical protein
MVSLLFLCFQSASLPILYLHRGTVTRNRIPALSTLTHQPIFLSTPRSPRPTTNLPLTIILSNPFTFTASPPYLRGSRLPFPVTRLSRSPTSINETFDRRIDRSTGHDLVTTLLRCVMLCIVSLLLLCFYYAGTVLLQMSLRRCLEGDGSGVFVCDWRELLLPFPWSSSSLILASLEVERRPQVLLLPAPHI